jgi:D-psicose/D-tagatose/L-ribulose 3-epimerase
MKIGVSAFAWTADFRESHLEILPQLREHGISSFEVPMFEPEKLPAARIRRAMEDNGLTCSVCAILPHGLNPISTDSDVRKKSRVHLMRCLDVAAEMGATLIGGPLYAPIGYFSGKRRSTEEWKRAVDAFQQLSLTLDFNRLDLSIEPVNRSETYFLTTAQDAAVLCDAINHPRIGVTIDTFHANIEEKTITDAISAAGSRLKHLHVSENHRGLLGSGHIDFNAVIDALRKIGYSRCLMIEGFGYSPKEQTAPGTLWASLDVSPEDIAFKGAQYLHGLLMSTSLK